MDLAPGHGSSSYGLAGVLRTSGGIGLFAHEDDGRTNPLRSEDSLGWYWLPPRGLSCRYRWIPRSKVEDLLS